MRPTRATILWNVLIERLRQVIGARDVAPVPFGGQVRRYFFELVVDRRANEAMVKLLLPRPQLGPPSGSGGGGSGRGVAEQERGEGGRERKQRRRHVHVSSPSCPRARPSNSS
eukprot:SAG11_NODE_845_length_6885_cov_6.782346_1_plen_113_part_00